jgi:predicted amidohydrolase YtcJ
MRYAAENGVTSVQDMSAAPEILRVYQALLARGELTVRISGHQPLATWQRLAAVGLRADFGGEKLHIGGLKGFADGSLGSTTALFFEPYLDAPNTSGLANSEMIPESKMQNHILDADRAGLQVAVHAIGDKANHMVLGMYEEAERQNGARDRRFRIEHAQHLRMDDIPRFGKLHVIASMQPYHCIDDGRWAEKRIGPERAKGTYAFRSLLDSGAVLAFGSDWDVAPMQPLMGIYAAATRRTLGWQAPGRLGAGAEDHRGRGHSSLHDGVGLCQLRREDQRVDRTRQAGGYGGRVGRHPEHARRWRSRRRGWRRPCSMGK